MDEKEVLESAFEAKNGSMEKVEPTDSPENAELKKAFQEGSTLYWQKKYEAAVEKWLPLAEKGYGEAQYYLGICYFEGNGVCADVMKAAEWFEKAFAQNADGYYVFEDRYTYPVAKCFYEGDGVERDYKKAVEWLEKVKLFFVGYDKAQFLLGDCYYYGHGVESSISQAMDYYVSAYVHGASKGIDRLKEIAKQGIVGADAKILEAKQGKKKAKELIREAKIAHRKVKRNGGVFIDE